MKTTFNKTSRSYDVQFTLEGAYIGDSEATPTLNLSFKFNKNYKAYIATASYVELEAAGGYFMQKWQSDWPMLRFGFTPTARYSEKALTEFTNKLLAEIETTGFSSPTLQNLYNRKIDQEVAA
jgi:hypothetical protein